MSIINPGYLSMFEDLSNHFKSEKNISLQEFFVDEVFSKLQNEFNESKLNFDTNLMFYNYESSKITDFMSELFSNELFINAISKITGLNIKSIDSKLYSFTHESYKLRKLENEKRIYLIFDMSSNWQEGNGGDICFTNDEDVLILSASNNTLTLVQADETTQDFITYCNHYTKNFRRNVLIGFLNF